MAGKKKRLTAAQTAYCRVNLVSAEDVELPEHVAIISNALERLWQYDGLYPNETDDLQVKRFELETPAAGEVTELAEHFRELDDNLAGLSRWDVIFTMFNRLENLSKVEKSSEEKNINNEKENFKMANSAEQVLMEAENEGREMETDVNNLLAGATLGKSIKQTNTGAEPEAVSNEARIAAEKFVEDQRNSRVYQSVNAKITQVVFSSPNPVNKAVDGEDAFGFIKEPKIALQTFLKKTGGKVVDGVLTFSNLIAGYEDDAREMYEALNKAVSDSEHRLKAHVTSGTPSIKGGFLKKGGKDTSEVISNAELREFLLHETMTQITTASDTVVKLKSLSVDKDTGTPLKKAVNSKDASKGIYSIQWSGRKTLAENSNIIVYFREKTDGVEPLPGLKSEMFVKYVQKKKKDEETGEVTVVPGTYRIPLMVDQYVLKVTNEELIKKFGDGSSAVGRVDTPIDFSNPQDLEKAEGDLASILAVVAESNITGEDFDKIRAVMADLKEKADKDAVDSFEDTDIE